MPCSCGRTIFIDDEDYESLKDRTWWCGDGDNVTCSIPVGNNKYSRMPLSRLIITVRPGQEPDHIDRDIHNNQKSNLRAATPSQNKANRRMFKNNTSGYRGVSLHNRDLVWESKITVNGKPKYLGRHKTIEEAAIAYDKAALVHFGEFANTNFPRENYATNS